MKGEVLALLLSVVKIVCPMYVHRNAIHYRCDLTGYTTVLIPKSINGILLNSHSFYGGFYGGWPVD